MHNYEWHWTTITDKTMDLKEARGFAELFKKGGFRLPTTEELEKLLNLSDRGLLSKDFGQCTCWVSDPEKFYSQNREKREFNIAGQYRVRLFKEEVKKGEIC